MAKSNILDIIQGISQVVALRGHDGALDDEGKPVEIGLNREEGHPILDSRTMDGFKVHFGADKLKISYHGEVMLRDVHKKDFEDEIETMMENIASFLKKEYKKHTGDALTLTPVKEKETKIDVRSLSRIRTWVEACKWYKIGGVEADEIRKESDGDRLDSAIRDWLELAKNAKRPENEFIKPKDNEKKENK